MIFENFRESLVKIIGKLRTNRQKIWRKCWNYSILFFKYFDSNFFENSEESFEELHIICRNFEIILTKIRNSVTVCGIILWKFSKYLRGFWINCEGKFYTVCHVWHCMLSYVHCRIMYIACCLMYTACCFIYTACCLMYTACYLMYTAC